MSMAIRRTETLKNTVGYPVFISPVLKTEGEVDDFISEQKTKFYPDFFYHHDKEISPEDILRDKFIEADREILEGWIENIEINRRNKDEEHFQEYLIKKGFTEEEADWTIRQVKDNRKRIKDWAECNKHNGGIASRFALLATVLGVLKAIGENVEGIPEAVCKFGNIIHGIVLGICGRKRYQIHARVDDEKGANDIQKKHFGNITSSLFGWAACFVEQYINPVFLPAIGFLEHGKRNMLAFVSTMPRLEWWRVRYTAYFGQMFATLLFGYMFNSPLALLGSEKHKQRLIDIKNTKILTFENYKNSFKKGLGVKEGESITTRGAELVGDLISGDIKKTSKATKHINEAIAPFVGTANFFLFGIFTPISAYLNLTDREPSKTVDFLSACGIAFQQVLYPFRFSVPEYVDSKKLLKELDNPLKTRPEIREEKEKLGKEKYKLFFAGLASNIAGILLPFSKLLGNDTALKRIVKSLTCELANDLVGYFLSRRRELNGIRALLKIKNKKQN